MEVSYPFRVTNNISTNGSSEDDEDSVSESAQIFSYVFIPLITSITVLGNTLVILAFIIDKRLRNQSNFFLLNLAICDFFIGAFCIPASASYILTGKWTLGDVLCKVWLVADNLMCTASVFNIVLISYDRFISITMAVVYRSQQRNHSQTAVKMALVWILAFLLYSPAIILWEYVNGDPLIPEGLCVAAYYYSWHFLLGASTFDFFLPLIGIVIFNFSIYWNIRKRSRKKPEMFTPGHSGMSPGLPVIFRSGKLNERRPESKNSASQSSIGISSSQSSIQAMKLSRDKKVAKSLTILVCVFGICWAPYIFLQTIRAACHDTCVESYWNQVTSWMLWINSSVNPIIYPLCHKSFRDALIKMSQKSKQLAPDLIASLSSTIQVALNKLHEEVALHHRFVEIEQRLACVEEDSAGAAAKHKDLFQLANRLQEKLEDLENRSRRSNFRLVGIPESVPPQDLRRLFESDLPQALGLDGKRRVERALCVGPQREPMAPSSMTTNQRPCQVICKYLDYSDKEDILRAYRLRREPLFIRGNKVLVFADYSAETMQKRRAFSIVCSGLHRNWIKFQLMYPATLKIKQTAQHVNSLTQRKLRVTYSTLPQ
ncbi:histamine H3 receptor-like [Bufo gargarizans]|uniref:histamine H3 receptor-like n=1 Tax=Bufo gargarizans TaxID=30331 RepID=UPI001CF1D806|nr:histamine H3 receptor-like [Bufo gargarizans]